MVHSVYKPTCRFISIDSATDKTLGSDYITITIISMLEGPEFPCIIWFKVPVFRRQLDQVNPIMIHVDG